MYAILRTKSIPYGVSPYGSLAYCLSALNQGGLCIYRPGAPDGPPDVYVSEPRANARRFMGNLATAAAMFKGRTGIWLEPLNEVMGTPMTKAQLEWWAAWMDEYIERAAAQGWPPLALPSLPPGHGDQLMFTVWKDVLINLRNHGGLFSMHDYTFQSQTGLAVCDLWEACRHVLNHRYMLAEGYEIPITITEAARWSGNAPVDVDDFVSWIEQVRRQGYVHSVWLWIGGHHGTWPLANLDGYYEQLAQMVQ